MKKYFNVVLIICLLISSCYIPKAQAKTVGDLKSELNQFVSEYNENQNKKKLNEQEVSNIKSNINSIDNTIYNIGQDVNKLNDEIYDLNEQIKKNEEEIKEILAFVQVQNGESAYLEYAFGAADFTDFIYRIAVSEQLTTHNDQLIDECNKNIEANKQKTEELAKKKEQMYSKQAELKVEMGKIQDRLQELDDESMSIEDQIAAKKSEIKVYVDKGCKDNEDITTCGRAILPPDTSFWRPLIKGKINGSLGLFGPRTPCGNGVSCNHKGMDFGGSSNIYSAANGLVVYIRPWNGTYQCAGNRVYIQHNVNGKIYTTGYLHMHEVYVKTGQTVTKDTVIGTMGGGEWYDTCSTGDHLHFEISTGTIASNQYDAYRFNPTNIINLPKSVNTYWYDRTTRL